MIGRRGFSRSFGVLVIGLSAAGPVRAAEGEFLRDAMSGIGLIEPQKAPITYNERAPLVMPPSLSGKPAKAAKAPKGGAKGSAAGIDTAVPMSLPPPQERSADPQWPKDPEVTRRRREAEDAHKPVVHGAGGRVNDNNQTLSPAEMQQGRMNDNNMTLSPGEIAGGRRAGAGLSNDPAGSPGNRAGEANWLNPFELLAGSKASAEPSEIEPERDTLTAPPTGYRKAPVKVSKEQGAPIGGSITGKEEADPGVYLRSQGR